MTTRERRNYIESLFNKSRLNYSRIGRLIGLSRQRIYQIINQKTKLKNREISGDNAPYANGIKSGGRDWTRELVRIRDKHTCQICKKVWKKMSGERRLDVHHVDEKHEGRSGERGQCEWDRKNMNRMTTLCHKCHLNLDSVRKKMMKKPYRGVRTSKSIPGRPVDKSEKHR